MRIRPLEERDRAWAEDLVREHFGSSRVVSRGVLHETSVLPGFVAEEDSTPIGLVQYRVEHGQAEIVVLISVRRRAGVGTALLQSLRRHGAASGLRRIWLITTNNNRAGQAFYAAIGMRQCAVYPDAVVEARTLKPELPEYDETGIAIRDEIEYEWLLNGA
jgi:RimJ/RimL family protein N-acetyltransferase